MCVDNLHLEPRNRKEFIESLNGEETFIGYKVISTDNRAVMGNRRFLFKRGWNYASPKATQSKNYKYRVLDPRGIHVFKSWLDANSYITGGDKIIKVKCHVNDIIVCGRMQIALRKVFIPKTELK